MNVRIKRLLSMLVVMAMVVSMIVPVNFTTAKAEETETPDTESGYVNPGQEGIDKGTRVKEKSAEVKSLFEGATGEVTAVCPVCGGDEPVIWTPIDSNFTAGSSISGHYYLAYAEPYAYTFASAASGNYYMKASGDLCLNLNGKSLTINTGRFLEETTSKDVNILDTAGTAVITGSFSSTAEYGSAIRISNENAKLHLFGGTYRKNVTEGGLENAVVVVNKGTLNMYEGATIEGGSNSGGKGGNVELKNDTSVFNMYGGTLTGGSAKYGGNAYIAATATANIYGGKILEGEASTQGGNIYVYRNCTLNIYGGFIASNSKNNIYVDTNLEKYPDLIPSITIAGGTVVGGITAKDDKNVDDEIDVTISGTAKIVPTAEGYTGTRGLVNCTFDTTQLTEGADVWVGSSLGSSYTWCEACQAVEEWTTLSAPDAEMADAHYRLKDDIVHTYEEEASANSFLIGNGCVDLNGCDVTVDGGRFLRALKGVTNIMDTKGGAVVTGSFDSSTNGAATLSVDNKNADVTLYGGTYKAMPDTLEGGADSNTSIIRHRNGKLTLKDGATVDATGYEQLGTYAAVYIGASATATDVQTFLMEGGAISGGLYLECTSVTTISGGTINDGVDVKAGASLALTGAPVIAEDGLNCGEGVLVDVNGLTADASIFVNAQLDVPFTTAYEGEADLSGVFSAGLADSQLTKNGDNQFVFVEKKHPVPNVFDPWNFEGLAYCPVCGGEEPVLWTVISEPTTIVEGEHYYFADNIEYDYADNAKHHFLDGAGCVNLNGKNVTINAGRFLRASGITNVMDTAGGAVVTGSSNLATDEGATIFVNSSDATLSLYGGTYKAMNDTLAEGVEDTDADICAVRVRVGSLNMYDGATIDGEGYNSGAEALVYVGYQGDKEYTATFNMYGGTIQNGSSTGNGGNIKIYPNGGGTAVVTIDGGEVLGGTAKYGGNVYLRGTGATLNVSDGAILNGTATTNGGNIYAYRDVILNVSGGIIAEGDKTNIYLDTKLDAETPLFPAFTMTDGTVVGGITAKDDKNVDDEIDVTISGTAKIVPTAEGYTGTRGLVNCTFDATQLTEGADVWVGSDLGSSYTWCEACQAVEEWTTLSAPDAEMADAHYRLKDDIVHTYEEEASANSFLIGNGCVDLNGCDVTVDGGRFLRALKGVTNIMDTKGGAVVTGSFDSSTNGAATLSVDNKNADVTLYGGTYKAMPDTLEGGADSNTSIIRHRNGKLTLKDGATVDATGYEQLGTYAAVYIGASATATDVQTFDMQGGTIKGGLYLECTSVNTISGGTVNDGVTVKAGASLALSGAPVIAEDGLSCAAGVLVDISGLTTDAKINVTGTGEGGVFTAAFEGAAALMSVFTVTNGYALYLNENQFALVVAAAFIEGVPYQTVEAALEAYDIASGKMISLNGEVEIAEPIILDAANSNELVLSGTGTVYGVDTSNDTFGAYNKVVINGDIVVADEYTAANGNRYMALKEGVNEYGFHRFVTKLTHVTLRTTAAGLYYKAEYKCDQLLRDRVLAYGVVLSTVDMPGADFLTDNTNLYTAIEGQFADQYGDEVANTVKTTSGSVFGILKETRDADLNSQYLTVDVYANSYILVDTDGNGESQFFLADTVNGGKTRADEGFSGTAWNLLEVVKSIDVTALTEIQMTQLVAFAEKWPTYLDDAGKAQWAEATSKIVA